MMKKKILILFTTILINLSFGQDSAPGMFEDEGDITGQGANGGLEGSTGDTTPGAPIDNAILYLLCLGTFYGLYSIQKYSKELN